MDELKATVGWIEALSILGVFVLISVLLTVILRWLFLKWVEDNDRNTRRIESENKELRDKLDIAHGEIRDLLTLNVEREAKLSQIIQTIIQKQ